MTQEDSSHRSIKSTTEEFKQSDSHNALGESVTKDPELNSIQERPNNNTEEASTDKPLGWSRLLFIGIGLWFAVFLYSLVSLPTIVTFF